MKRKMMYETPATEVIMLKMNHSILVESDNRGQAGAEDAQAIDGTW